MPCCRRSLRLLRVLYLVNRLDFAAPKRHILPAAVPVWNCSRPALFANLVVSWLVGSALGVDLHAADPVHQLVGRPRRDRRGAGRFATSLVASCILNVPANDPALQGLVPACK